MSLRSTAATVSLLLLASGSGASPPEASSPSPSTGAATGEAAGSGLVNGSFHVDVDGFDLHYEVRGDGPVLMVVPNSWGLDVPGLRGVLGGLEEHLTMVYFDPRGMGGSGPARERSELSMARVRADFEALRRHLGLDRVHAIGWSNGAMNLVLLAAEQPESIASAIFLHGVAHFTDEDMEPLLTSHPDLFRAFGELMARLPGDEMSEAEKAAALHSLYIDAWFPLMFADREAAAERLAAIFDDTTFGWRQALYSNDAEEGDGGPFDAREELGGITARCLVIAGAHDLTPVEKVREIHEGCADSRFELFEQSGHFASVEEPDRFVRVVLEHIRTDG